jgi:S-formylglutathione hydrolase
MAVKELQSNKFFGGYNKRFQHASKECGCDMKFFVYFPPAAEKGKVPVLYFLSGLTCTDENFTQKSGAQRKAAELGIALVVTDTSPRGLDIEGEDESMDLGTSAGFYLNATTEKWKNYRMYDYVTKELPALLESDPAFSSLDTKTASIMGHSMGGHGAIMIGLKNPTAYKSISAFAPICNASAVPMGQKAFTAYLGDQDKAAWKQYDATELAASYSGPALPPILVDQGDADGFLEQDLTPQALVDAAKKNGGVDINLRMQKAYDHSYFFIATFVADHLDHHAKYLEA